MLRIGLLSSVIPLVLMGGVARDWALARHCPGAGEPAPFARPLAFTDDPLAATVRVQVVDRAELADLAIVDGTEAAAAQGCGVRDIGRFVSVGRHPVPGEPVVYLSRQADSDYRIYVDSSKVSVRQAAALIVGARGGQMRLAGQRPDSEPTGSIHR